MTYVNGAEAGSGLLRYGNAPVSPAPKAAAPKKETFFRTMSAEEYKTFSTALKDAPQPKKEAAAATLNKIERPANMPLREFVMMPGVKEAAVIPVLPRPEPKPVPVWGGRE